MPRAPLLRNVVLTDVLFSFYCPTMVQFLTDDLAEAFRFTVELAIRPIIRKVYGRRVITDQQVRVWAHQVAADILGSNWIATRGPPSEGGAALVRGHREPGEK